MFDAKVKTGSTAGITQAAKEAAPFGELEGKAEQFKRVAGGMCMSDESWMDWSYRQPPRGILIQVWREAWETPTVTTRENIPLETNIIGLKWRLTGIGREKLKSYPPEVRAQIEAVGPYSFWSEMFSAGLSAQFYCPGMGLGL